MVDNVSQPSTIASESVFRLRELNSDNAPEGVCHTSNNVDVTSAVIEHFNAIQTKKFHFGKPNYINPNAYHGIAKAPASSTASALASASASASGSGSSPNNGSPKSGNFNVSSPVDQFNITSFASVYASIVYLYVCLTNIGFYLIVAAFLGLILKFITTNFKKLISDN